MIVLTHGLYCCWNERQTTIGCCFRSTATGITFLGASLLIVFCLILTMSSEFSVCPAVLRKISHHAENNRWSRNLLACLFVLILFLASFSALVSNCLFVLSARMQYTSVCMSLNLTLLRRDQRTGRQLHVDSRTPCTVSFFPGDSLCASHDPWLQ